MPVTLPLLVVAMLMGQPQQTSTKPKEVYRSSEFWERPGPKAPTRGLFKIPLESPFGEQISVTKQLPLDGRTVLVVFDVGSGRYVRSLAIYGMKTGGPLGSVDQPGLSLRWISIPVFGSDDEKVQIEKAQDGKSVLFTSHETGTIKIGLPDYRRRAK